MRHLLAAMTLAGPIFFWRGSLCACNGKGPVIEKQTDIWLGLWRSHLDRGPVASRVADIERVHGLNEHTHPKPHFLRCGKHVAHCSADNATTTLGLEIAFQGRRPTGQCFAGHTKRQGDSAAMPCAFSSVTIKSGPSRKAQTDLREECLEAMPTDRVCLRDERRRLTSLFSQHSLPGLHKVKHETLH